MTNGIFLARSLHICTRKKTQNHMKQYKTVFFDYDGTLLDTSPLQIIDILEATATIKT